MQLSRAEWLEAQQQHRRRIDSATLDHRQRVGDGKRHPVMDFLFTYYSLRLGQLRRWQPGPRRILADASDQLPWRWHHADARGAVTLDRVALSARHGPRFRAIATLLRHTTGRPAQYGCFGLHEWAMVYQLPPDTIRHSSWPLRLGSAGTDEVVAAHPIRCSHYDAFRFFTTPAQSLNLLQPQLADREQHEQRGCLHANMDLYKWAYKLLPATPGELLADCFEFAGRIREVDMRASPYDLRELGYQPITIETAAGKAEYVALQRQFVDEGDLLRRRLLMVIDAVLEPVDAG